MPDESKAEVARLLELLKTVIKISGFPVSEIERRMGQGAGYLSRLWAGAIGIKLRHVFEILKAIELHPTEFFRLAYPQDAPQPSPTGKKLRAFAAQFQASTPRPEAPTVTSEQVQELLTGLRELLTNRTTPTNRPPTPDRQRRK